MADGEASFEPGSAVDFAGDEHGAVEEERRLTVLDDVETGALERRPAGGGQLNRVDTGDGEATPGPELGMDHHRQVEAAEPVDETRQAGGVVGMAMAADDDLHVARIAAKSP